MTYFPDLSPYRYALPRELVDVVNVGWLARDRLVPRGPVPPGFLDALKDALVGAKAHQTRGDEPCCFCPLDDTGRYLTVGSRTLLLGSAEIWVPGVDTVYAAPSLIVHYVEAHEYLPPTGFIDAVMGRRWEGWGADREAKSRRAAVYAR